MNRQRIDVEWRKRPGCAWFDCGGIIDRSSPGEPLHRGGILELGSLRLDVYLPGAYWLGTTINDLIWRWIDWRNPA